MANAFDDEHNVRRSKTATTNPARLTRVLRCRDPSLLGRRFANSKRPTPTAAATTVTPAKATRPDTVPHFPKRCQ